MNVFHLIGRLALAKEGATMAQKRIGAASQGMMGRDGSEEAQATLGDQLTEVRGAKLSLTHAIHNIDLVEQAILDEMTRQTRAKQDDRNES